MPRSIEINASAKKVDLILGRIRHLPGVVSVGRQAGASVDPPGDILSLHVVNDTTRPVMQVLSDIDLTDDGVVRTSEVLSSASAKFQSAIDKESTETDWDEMAFMLRRDSNLSVNYLATMALAGAIAAGGLWTNTLHLIIGSMIVAPAFEPLVRLPFGVITGMRQLIPSGFLSIAAGYLSLAAGAALTAFALDLWTPGQAPLLRGQQWVHYWSTLTFPSVLMSVFGGIAGAVVVSGQRSVLTTGVMITLALIPSMAIVGLALVVGDVRLAGQGLLRWLVDAVLVVGMGGAVFWLKYRFVHHGGRALS